MSIPAVYAEDSWYDVLIPYRLNIGATNDQTSLTTFLDRDLTVYSSDWTPYPNQNSKNVQKTKNCTKLCTTFFADPVLNPGSSLMNTK